MSEQLPASPRRVGLLVPSSNTVMEPDFYHNLPAGWTLHTARMHLEDVTPETEARMLDEYTLPAAGDLATTRPHVVVFGCTSAGALRGNAYDDDLVQRISQVVSAPTVSVIRSARECLKEYHAEKIVVITPYVEKLNIQIKASLENDGLNVLRILGLNILQNTRIAQVPPTEIFDLAERAVRGLKPEALFVSCTNFPAMSVLPELRHHFPFPVITSNQAVLEASIKAAQQDLPR